MLLKSGNGFTPNQAALAVTVFGILSLIGRLLVGLIDSLSNLKILALLNIGCAGAIVMMITLQDSLTWVYIGCGLHGLCSGPMVTMGATCIANLVGIEYEKFSCVIGLDLMTTGFGIAIGESY